MLCFSAAAPPFMKNGFVVGCERTSQAVYIDPGDEVDELLGYIARRRLDVTAILLTHAHVDHVSGVARSQARAGGADLAASRRHVALPARRCSRGRCSAVASSSRRRWTATTTAPARWGRFGDYDVSGAPHAGPLPGQRVSAGGPQRRAARWNLFVGDTLFAGSIGRTDLPGGDYETLMRAITEVLLPLGDDARVHPGHGPDTTIGRERATNAFLLEWMAQRPAPQLTERERSIMRNFATLRTRPGRPASGWPLRQVS